MRCDNRLSSTGFMQTLKGQLMYVEKHNLWHHLNTTHAQVTVLCTLSSLHLIQRKRGGSAHLEMVHDKGGSFGQGVAQFLLPGMHSA